MGFGAVGGLAWGAGSTRSPPPPPTPAGPWLSTSLVRWGVVRLGSRTVGGGGRGALQRSHAVDKAAALRVGGGGWGGWVTAPPSGPQPPLPPRPKTSKGLTLSRTQKGGPPPPWGPATPPPHSGHHPALPTMRTTQATRAVLKGPDFFLLRTALQDRPKGPPTANRQLPPTANRHRPSTANRRQLPPATHHQLPTATNRRQPPPTTNCQPPTGNLHQPPTANRHQPWLNI